MTTEAASTRSTLETTRDAFLGGQLHVRQPARGYRAGLDAVMLAAAVVPKGAVTFKVADLGAGAGVVGLAIATRLAAAHVTLVEKNEVLAHLAGVNAAENGLAGRVLVVVGDVTAPHGTLAGAGLDRESFDQIVMNPPYYEAGRSDRSPDAIKGQAHQLGEGDLERWVRTAATLARAGATLTIVHRADAIGDLLAALDGRFGAARILPLHSTADLPAHRVIVNAVKGRRSRPTLLPGRIVHGAEGTFAPWAEAILRDGASLPL